MASFEDTLASIPGYGGYLAKRKMNEDDGTGDLQKLSALMSLSEMAQKTKQASLARESTDKYLATLGDGPDAQTMRAYGQINPAGLLETLVKQKMEQDLLASESARLGLNQPQPQAPQVLTGEEPFAAKSGDMAGLSGFQGNPQELMMQIAKSNASPQDKQMMFSQLQEQMRGTGQQPQQPQSEMPPMPAQFAGITREMALNMQRSPVKSLQLQGKQVGDWYEKRDMLEQRGQQRKDLMEFGASLKQPPQPQRPVEVMKLDGSGTEYVTPEESYGRSPPGGPSGGKALPISAAKILMSNQQNLRRAQEAQALLGGKLVGAAVGDKNATGLKGYLPDVILQRQDPEGIDTRAAIADLGSLVIHDRSGAAVTALEFPRLQPFIPSSKDDPTTARKKLNRFVMEYKNIVDEQIEFYKESGYKVPSESLKPADIREPSNDAGLVKVKSVNEAMKLKRGTRFIDPNGVERVRP